MRGRTAVVDPTGNYEENNQRLGKNLGRAKMRRKLFDVIYGRGSKPREEAAYGCRWHQACRRATSSKRN
jgi:hypothetical protein